MVPHAGGTRDIVGEALGPLQDAFFQPHQFSVVGHPSQIQVEIRICLGAIVVSMPRDAERRSLVGKLREFVDLPRIRAGGRKLCNSAFHEDSKLKEVAHFLQAHFRHKIASAGDDFEQMFMV